MSSFTVNKADLEFILKQIKIAEATSIGYTPSQAPVTILKAIMDAYGLTASDAAIAPFGLRTVDGSSNSLVPGQDKFGAADTLFPRLTDPVYRNDTDGDSIDFDGPGGMPPLVQGNYGNPGNVVDADPRIISNLVVDMSIDNPAAIRAFLSNPLSVAYYAEKYGYEPTADNHPDLTDDDLQTIPNQSPDGGLSPGFNAWMTFFGQFFDHGLDLVTKGNAGTVYVPLQADDPLIAGADGELGTADDLPEHLRFMVLTRATQTVDENGVVQHENTTTSFVDQNQTYTSHASHQVFLREYARFDANGDANPGGEVTVATGRLLDGTTASGSLDGAIGNWAEVKAQALAMLGINLRDVDALNVPLLLTDQYGKFIPGPNGYAQLVMAPDAGHATNWLKEGNPDGSVTTEGAIGTNHAFLDDLAHNAVPGTVYDPDGPGGLGLQAVEADSDSDIGNAIPVDFAGRKMAYDDELLDKHFITGDGRGNENIALTAVHSIFHSEHNRLVDANKATILAAGDIAFLNEWLIVDQPSTLTAAEIQALDPGTLAWDGERLFQAARFGAEMQYQHLAFEEFARRIQPMIDPFGVDSSPDVDPAIVAEFAHTVYRFGHSMLTGTVDRLDADLNPLDPLDPDSVEGQQTLLAMFLNPLAYIESGDTLEEVNANLIRGLSRDVGNAMDEFIVTDVRSNLLGLPLDLAVLNIVRGRETGIPSLNETRAQLHGDTGLADLEPYESWTDFAMNLKNTASVVNFIAAYGTHASLTGATSLAARRDAAELLVFGGPGAPSDRLDFLNATGDWAPDGEGPNDDTRGGLDLVDLWLGGLAEKTPAFGGMLGTTFNYVFEFQMESLQFGDRLYYLARTEGTNFLNNLEPNSFSDLVMRNTELGDAYATHLNGQLFLTPDHIIELDRGIAQEDYNGADPGLDPTWDGSNPVLEALQGPKVLRDYTGATTIVDDNGTPGDASDDVTHDVGGFLRVLGGEHFVLGGTEGDDTIYGDGGIDTLWGDGGDDYLNGGTESDDVFGGAGNDIIDDPSGDDVLRGQQGNDVITSARGADLLFGDQGQDYIVLGQDASEVFGGTGTDFILGGMGDDALLGNEGDDWIEGGGGSNAIAGDNSDRFSDSPIIGHDVLFGQGEETDHEAESGDDIMGSDPGVSRYQGMSGFDWGMAKSDRSAIRFDLQLPVSTASPEDVLRDRFDQVEALSGWENDDRLDGDDRGHSGGSSSPASVSTQPFADHLLTAEGIDRIFGLRELLGGGTNPAALVTLFGAGATSFRDGNILIGGGGNDTLRGRGGYDILDGDAWLNVRIRIVLSEATAVGGAIYPRGTVLSAESMSTDTIAMGPNAGKVFHTLADGTPDFGDVAFGGSSLSSLMLDGSIDPGDMSIVREILDGTTGSGETDVDIAIFQGGALEYEIEGTQIVYDADGVATGRTGTISDVDGDGFIKVKDLDDGLVAAPGRAGGLAVSRGALTDDTDLLKNIERLQFADKTIAISDSNALAVGTVTISDETPFDFDNDPLTPSVVSPIVGQVLTATLSDFGDAEGIPLDPATGMPVGLTFDWETTEAGNGGGWAKIASGPTYTVRSVDPSHVLRAVAVFKDAAGVEERIASVRTDNVTMPFSIAEWTATGTVVAPVPFSLDHDPFGFGGTGVTEDDVVSLTHGIQPGQDAGGRFAIVDNQLVVANGGPIALNYDIGNQYQIVIDTYTDTIANGGVLMASRQFTVRLTDRPGNFIDGSGGDDLIDATHTLPGQRFATDFADMIFGNGGNDTLDGGSGDDTLDGGDGKDTAAYGSATAGVVVDLTIAGPQNTGGAGTDTVNDIERLTGSAHADSLTGNGGRNVLRGLDGNDVVSGGDGNDTVDGGLGDDMATGGSGRDILRGRQGSDTLAGGSGDDTAKGGGGNDIIDGGAGNDTLAGGGGDDSLDGGSGADRLNGGAGANTLTGGSGNDSFVFDSPLVAGTITTVTDLSGGADTIALGSTVFTAVGPVGPLAAGRFFIGSAAHDASDRIIYNSASGALLYDPDGNGGQAATQFATVTPGIALTAGDFRIV